MIFYILNICLTPLIIVAASDLPVYSHYCHGMDRQGVFYECYPGERDGEPTVEQCSGSTQHRQHVKTVPCCVDREVSHSVLNTGIIPEPPVTKQTADVSCDTVLLQQQDEGPRTQGFSPANDNIRKPRSLPLYRAFCSLLE